MDYNIGMSTNKSSDMNVKDAKKLIDAGVCTLRLSFNDSNGTGWTARIINRNSSDGWSERITTARGEVRIFRTADSAIRALVDSEANNVALEVTTYPRFQNQDS